MTDEVTVPDLRAELSMVLEESRRLLTAIWARDDHAYAMDYMLYHADRLQFTLHNLFGDPIPAPIPAPRPVVAPVVATLAPLHSPPRHGRRALARRTLAVLR